MKNLITSFFIITTLYVLCICEIKPALAAPSNGNIETPRNRARGVSRYHSRATQYGRMKPDTFINDFGGKFDKNNLGGEFFKIISSFRRWWYIWPLEEATTQLGRLRTSQIRETGRAVWWLRAYEVRKRRTKITTENMK